MACSPKNKQDTKDDHQGAYRRERLVFFNRFDIKFKEYKWWESSDELVDQWFE